MTSKSIITDGDGCIYTSGSGYLSMDQLKLIDRNHRGIWKDIKNTFERDKKIDWESRISNLVEITCKYGVTFDDYVNSARRVVKASEVDKNLENFLRLVNPSEMIVFTLSGTEPMLLYVKEKIMPIIPDTRIMVGGTDLYYEADIPHRITGVRKMWGPCKRAEEAKELSKKGEAIIIGNDECDIPMLRNGALSIFLTKDKPRKEDNIFYTTMEKMSEYLRDL